MQFFHWPHALKKEKPKKFLPLAKYWQKVVPPSVLCSPPTRITKMTSYGSERLDGAFFFSILNGGLWTHMLRQTHEKKTILLYKENGLSM